MVSMVVEKINEEKRKLEVMVKFSEKKTPLELVLCKLKKYNFCYIYNIHYNRFQ
jgi:transcription antitermination factor NusG